MSTEVVGANPFKEQRVFVRTLQYDLECLLSVVGLLDLEDPRERVYDGVTVARCTMNPRIKTVDGLVEYQRPLVWTLEDKQSLLDSVYDRLDCGKVVIRQKTYDMVMKEVKEGREDVAYIEVVDGKQRLSAIKDFIHNKYPDRYGNYFSDLSKKARREFQHSQALVCCQLPDDISGRDILEQFLRVNVAGVPQSSEHIQVIKKLLEVVV